MMQKTIQHASRTIAIALPAARTACRFSRPSSRLQPLAHPFTRLISTSRRSYAPDASSQTEKSAETESAPKITSDVSAGKEGGAANADAAKLKESLEAKTKEAADFKDRYVRMVADYRTLQDRTKREVVQARDFALQKLAKDLLGSMDNLEHALRSVAQEKLASPPSTAAEDASASIESLHKDLKSLHGGLSMTERILVETLAKHGLERVDPSINKEKFDPNLHEAVFMAPQPDKEDGTVFYTEQRGFSLNGRVIRAPKVGVVRNS